MTSIGRNSDPRALNSNEMCFVMRLSHAAQGQRNSPHQCPFLAPQVSYPCPASHACAAPARSSPARPAFRSCPDPQVQPRSHQVQSRGG